MNAKIHDSKPGCQVRAAFTLAELLVVIAILATLSAMLLPALAGTRSSILCFQCLENQKRLVRASILYANDYNGAVVLFAAAGGFWSGPSPTISGGMTKAQAQAAVNAGLTNHNSNLLFQYAPSLSIYHCPGDRRDQLTPGSGWAYDSYSKTQNVGGDPYNSYWGAGATYTRISAITNTSRTACFTEDADWRSYSHGTWVVQWSAAAGSFLWSDAPAMFHGNDSTVAFADGHAELHAWQSAALISAGLASANGVNVYGFVGPSSGPDYLFVHDFYRFPGWR